MIGSIQIRHNTSNYWSDEKPEKDAHFIET